MRWTKVVLAAALVLGVAPAADGASRDRVSRQERFQAWLDERARLSRGLPLADKQRSIEDWGYYAYTLAAGDLDGDGHGDVLDVRSHLQYDEVLGFVEETRLEAFRGKDGKALWNVTVPPASYVFALATAVGTDGKPGVVVVALRDTGIGSDVGATGEYDTTVLSYNGAGAPLWARELPGVWADSLTGWTFGDAMVAGFFNAVSGGGTDLLIQSTAMAAAYEPTGTLDRAQNAAQYAVLDGATGVVKPIGQPIRGEWETPYPDTVGDLDKDGLDDFVVDTEVDRATLTAYSSKDGRQLWARPDFVDGPRSIIVLPDATGDGKAEVGVLSYAYGPSLGQASASSVIVMSPDYQVVLIDGASGAIRWRKAGNRLYAIGDADRKAGSELVVGETVANTHIGFTAAAYTGSGKRLWSVTRKLRTTDSENKTQYASWGATVDFDADGVKDIGYSVVSGAGKKPKRDDGSVDGRTGKVSRDPVPDMYATRAWLDGRGADAYVASLASGTLTFDAWRGDAATRLWSVAVAARGIFDSSMAVSVDGDRCDDLVLSTYGDDGYVDIVLSGSTGKPLWQLSRSEWEAGAVSAPQVKRHKVYRKGC